MILFFVMTLTVMMQNIFSAQVPEIKTRRYTQVIGPEVPKDFYKELLLRKIFEPRPRVLFEPEQQVPKQPPLQEPFKRKEGFFYVPIKKSDRSFYPESCLVEISGCIYLLIYDPSFAHDRKVPDGSDRKRKAEGQDSPDRHTKKLTTGKRLAPQFGPAVVAMSLAGARSAQVYTFGSDTVAMGTLQPDEPLQQDDADAARDRDARNRARAELNS